MKCALRSEWRRKGQVPSCATNPQNSRSNAHNSSDSNICGRQYHDLRQFADTTVNELNQVGSPCGTELNIDTQCTKAQTDQVQVHT